MAGIYDKHGIRFQYPKNWTVDESEMAEDANAITVYSPGGAFWSVVWRDPREDPHEMALEALSTLKQEYPQTEAEPATETIAGQEISGFDVSFYYLDLISTAILRGFRTPAASYLVLCQAEDREFREIEPVFQAMTTSLLQAG